MGLTVLSKLTSLCFLLIQGKQLKHAVSVHPIEWGEQKQTMFSKYIPTAEPVGLIETVSTVMGCKETTLVLIKKIM